MNEQEYRQLITQIAELKSKVEYGFDSVHQRLDRLNGSVAKHEERKNGGYGSRLE